MSQWIDTARAFLAENSAVICLFLLAALAAALALAVIMRAKEKRTMQRMEELEDHIMEQLAEREQAARYADKEQSEALFQTMRDFNDSIVRMMGEISRTQQGQLDSFGGQLRAVSRTEEDRMARMQQSVETRLEAYDTRMDSISRVLDDKLSQNEQRMERMRSSLENGLSRMQQDNAQKLEQMRQTVDEKLNATLDRRLGESFQLVTQRLEQVAKGLGEMQTLASGVGDLKKVLTNVKTRGTWGEVQLGTLLEQIMAPGQYQKNVCVCPGSAERVDYAIVLPGQSPNDGEHVFLPIDAKFPQEDYLRLAEASEQGDAMATDAAQKALTAALRLQARKISEKYINPPHTTDYALMFLPVEGLYAEVLRADGLAEQLQSQYRVVVTGPTTLAALLNSLQMGFRTLAIEQRSSEVWALLGAVKTEFGRFSELLVRTQKKLRQASDSIEDAARKTRTIQRRLSDVEELSEREADKILPLPDDLTVRGDEEDWE